MPRSSDSSSAGCPCGCIFSLITLPLTAVFGLVMAMFNLLAGFSVPIWQLESICQPVLYLKNVHTHFSFGFYFGTVGASYFFAEASTGADYYAVDMLRFN